MNKNKSLKNSRKTFELTAMALPALLLIIVFKYLPMFGLVIAFKDYRDDLGILKSPWCGLKNFEFFFKSADAVKVIGNTLLINFVFITTSLFGAVVLAILLAEITNRHLIKTYQTVMLLPYFLSMTVVANIS